jgi:hypothetical protein
MLLILRKWEGSGVWTAPVALDFRWYSFSEVARRRFCDYAKSDSGMEFESSYVVFGWGMPLFRRRDRPMTGRFSLNFEAFKVIILQ